MGFTSAVPTTSTLVLPSRRLTFTVTGRLLCVWAICVGIATLAPFEFRTPNGDVLQGLAFQYGPHQQHASDFVLNLLLFLPLGALLHHASRSRGMTPRTVVVTTAAAAVALSATVEYLQTFLALRHSSLVDVAANTAGALGGVVIDRAQGAALVARFERIRSRVSRLMLVGTLASVAVLGLGVSAMLQARSRLNDWSMEYPLIIGNERNADRPWHGTIFSLEMTDETVSASALRDFVNGKAIQLPGARIAAYDFRRSPYVDASGNLPALRWSPGGPDASDSGARVGASAWLTTDVAVAGFASRLRATNAFSLRVVCAPSDTSQTGPARIVTNSSGPLSRNFMVGQDGHALVFRLRTPATGPNGYPLQFIVPGMFSTSAVRDIIISYDGATVMAAARGTGIRRTELTAGAIVALRLAEYRVDTANLEKYQTAYLIVLFGLPAIVLALFGRDMRNRLVLGGVFVLMFPPLLELALARAVGRPWDVSNVAAAAIVGMVVFAALVLLLSPSLEWRRKDEQSAVLAHR